MNNLNYEFKVLDEYEANSIENKNYSYYKQYLKIKEANNILNSQYDELITIYKDLKRKVLLHNNKVIDKSNNNDDKTVIDNIISTVGKDEKDEYLRKKVINN